MFSWDRILIVNPIIFIVGSVNSRRYFIIDSYSTDCSQTFDYRNDLLYPYYLNKTAKNLGRILMDTPPMAAIRDPHCDFIEITSAKQICELTTKHEYGPVPVSVVKLRRGGKSGEENWKSSEIKTSDRQ